MKVSDILQFIFIEMQKAIEEKSKERVLDLGTAVDVLYEVSKNQNDHKIQDVLHKLNYVVFHYEDEFSFVGNYLMEIERTITEIQSL